MDVVWNLTEINHLFEALSRDCQIFKDNYDEWVVQRKRTISVFQKLKHEVDNIHVSSSTAKAVGSGVGILGGLATITGFALTFSNDENLRQLGKKMTKGGSLASFLGSAGAATSSLIEVRLSKAKLDEAKVCLEKDKQLTAELMPWLRNVKNLDVLFEKVFGCSILSVTWQDIYAIFENLMVIIKQGTDTLKDVEKIISSGAKNLYSDVVKGYNKNNLMKISKKIQLMNDKTKLVLKGFCNDPNVRRVVSEICYSFKRLPVISEVCEIQSNMKFDLKILNRIEMLILSQIVSVADSTAANVLNAVSESYFAAAKICTNVVVFLSAVDDIQKRNSYYSKLLKDTELILSEELRIIGEAYNELNK